MGTTTETGTSNPYFGSASKMVLKVPKEIKVTLVDSTELFNLKVWASLANLFLNITFGFWVWYWQNSIEALNQFLLVVSVIASVISLVFIGLTWYFNNKLNKETSEINYSPSKNEA